MEFKINLYDYDSRIHTSIILYDNPITTIYKRVKSGGMGFTNLDRTYQIRKRHDLYILKSIVDLFIYAQSHDDTRNKYQIWEYESDGFKDAYALLEKALHHFMLKEM